MNHEKLKSILDDFIKRLNDEKLPIGEALCVASNLFSNIAVHGQMFEESLDEWVDNLKKKLRENPIVMDGNNEPIVVEERKEPVSE